MTGHPDLVGLMDLLLADPSRLDGALADMGVSENGDEILTDVEPSSWRYVPMPPLAFPPGRRGRKNRWGGLRDGQ